MRSRDASAVDREGVPTGATPTAMTLGLGSASKIRDRHLDRLAIVYVRQSSPQQVLENRESRERQYALAQLAQRLGWPAERVVIIDEDQARSGKSADNRSGYQRLMTEVTLSHVGIVLGLELSRLSRSNAEWHRLIDVCGIFHTLLCDQDGVYDALDGNDRLLLGMKSAMSEYELITMRNRLLRGSRNKAERGELFLAVPLGYLKTPAGEVIQEPDEQARGMIELVFDKFDELGSAYAVFRYLVVNGLRLGFRRQRGGRIGELEWRPPSPARILSILRHPIYAGAYAYGLHRAGTKDPATGRAEGGKWFVPPEELAVLLRDRLPAYIAWDRYLSNLQTPRAESIAPRCAGRAEARRGVAARPGRLRAMRPPHDDPIQGRQEARLSLRRVLAAGPGRAVRVHRGGDAGRPGRAARCSARWSRPRWTSACAPSRASSKSGSASTTSGARRSNAPAMTSRGPSDCITPWSPRTGWWRARWRRAGRRHSRGGARWRRITTGSWRAYRRR